MRAGATDDERATRRTGARRGLLAIAVAALALLAFATERPAPAEAIVGGTTATRPYPFMVQLALRDPEDGAFSFACGASLVRPGWVLTAAHCVDEKAPGDIRLTAGRARLSDTGGTGLPVAQVIVDPAYAGGTAHDVALLRLARDTPAAAASPVRLAGPGDRAAFAPGVRATVIGWGATGSGGAASNELREVQVPIQSDATCETTVGATVGYDRETTLCAGETLGGGDSCQGDSGGPLLAPDAAGALILVGTVSSGLGCAMPTQYGVYARTGDATLRAFLDAHLPAQTGGGGSGGSGPTPEPPGDALPGPARITIPATLGSARVAQRRGRIRLTLRTSAPLTGVRATATRAAGRGRRTTVARGTRARLTSRGTVVLRRRARLRAGALRITVTARDADGVLVRRTATARLRR